MKILIEKYKDEEWERWVFGNDDDFSFEPKQIRKYHEGYTEKEVETFLEWAKTRDEKEIGSSPYTILFMAKHFNQSYEEILQPLQKLYANPEFNQLDDLVSEFSGGHLGIEDEQDCGYWKIFFLRHPEIKFGRFAQVAVEKLKDEEWMDTLSEKGSRGYKEFENFLKSLIPESEKPGDTIAESKTKQKLADQNEIREIAKRSGGVLHMIPFHYFYGGDEAHVFVFPFQDTPEGWAALHKTLPTLQILREPDLSRILAKDPEIKPYTEEE